MDLANVYHLQKNDKTLRLDSLYKSDFYLFSYARYALLEVLQSLQIQSIYIPSFICSVVVAPLKMLNIKIYFYELNENLQPLLQEIKCDCILAVNYFGFPCDMRIFNEYAKKNNALVIEDNAHGLFSKDENCNLLGTRGDIGLLSIRKTIFLPNGAALLINNKSVYAKFKKDLALQEIKYSGDDAYWGKKRKLRSVVFNKFIGLAIVQSRAFMRFVRGQNGSESYVDSMSYNRFVTPLLANKSVDLDLEFEINRRKELYRQVSLWALKFGIRPIFELDSCPCAVPYEFAYIDNGRADEFRRFLYTKGLFSTTWPDLPKEVESSKSFYLKVKVVPFLW